MQWPVCTHGVFLLRLLARIGAAVSSILAIAASRSGTILFRPTTSMTFAGPNVMELVLFPQPSRLTISPVMVRAFTEDKKRSAVI